MNHYCTIFFLSLTAIYLFCIIDKSMKEQSLKELYKVSLPMEQGGFGTPILNFNDVPQLEQMQQAVYSGTYGNDSVANLKLTSQHLNLIKNIN